jgi:hypothetical protein
LRGRGSVDVAGTFSHETLIFSVDRVSALRRAGFENGTRETLGKNRSRRFVLQPGILGLEAVDESDELLPRVAVQQDADEIGSPPNPQTVKLEQAARHSGFGTELAECDLGFQTEPIDRRHRYLRKW